MRQIEDVVIIEGTLMSINKQIKELVKKGYIPNPEMIASEWMEKEEKADPYGNIFTWKRIQQYAVQMVKYRPEMTDRDRLSDYLFNDEKEA